MAIRSRELDHVIAEICAAVEGARIQDVRVPSSDRLVLTLHRTGHTIHLMFVVQSVHARVHLVPRPPPNPPRALAIQGLLRDRVRGRCTALDRPSGDRIVRMAFAKLTLLAELTGRHGNLFILDPEGNIDATLLPNRSYKRDLRPGSRWVPPASGTPPEKPARFEPPDVGGQLARYYEELENRTEFEARRAAATRQLRTIRKRLSRKVERQQAESDRAEDIAQIRREADLLNLHRRAVRRGATEVELDDPFEAAGTTRIISLDPSKTISDEIERRYHQARRMERGQRKAREQWANTSRDLEQIIVADARVRATETMQALDDVLGELPPRWQPPPTRSRRAAKRERTPFRTYISTSGQRIQVGRSGRDNDVLTFRHARGRDIWLHVTGRPGAHVVIPVDESMPDPITLEQAAQLVLAHSGVEEGETEVVVWTRVKYVRRLKGGKPGQVTYSQDKVMVIRRSRAALEGVDSGE